MRRAHRALGALTIVLGTAGCVDSSAGGGATTDGGRITVEATATDCRLSDTTTTAGPVTFAVTNAGTDVTEFYLLAEDGVRVVAEVESIGPGLTRELVAQVNPGTYWTACKPGMVGDGIRTELTVTGAAPDNTSAGPAADQVAAAEQQDRTSVVDQVDALVADIQAFATADTAGDDDPLLELREADLAPGQPWTGRHLIEKDLWPPPATPTSSPTLDTRFTALQDLLATHGDETAGFPAYDELSAADVRALSAAVDAVSEPLSRLTVTVTGA